MKMRTLVAISTLAVAFAALTVASGRYPQLAAQAEAIEGARAALDLIPEDALSVTALDVSALPSLLPLLPAEMLTGPDSILATSLDAVMTHRIGVSVRDVRTLAMFLGADGGSWGVVGLGSVTGEVFLPPATTVGEQTIYSREPAEGSSEPPLYYAGTSDWFVLGSLSTVTDVVNVVAGAGGSYAGQPMVSQLLEGADPVVSLLAIFSGDGAAPVLQMAGWSFASEPLGMSLAIGPYRARWSLAFESAEIASDAGDAVGELLTGANETLRQFDADIENSEAFLMELLPRMLHTLASAVLSERTRYTHSNNVVHLEMLGPPSLSLSTLIALRQTLQHHVAEVSPDGSPSEAE